MSTGPVVEVEVVGDKLAADRILQVGRRAENLLPVKPALDVFFHEDEKRRFDLNGPGWLPLDDATVALKEANGWEPGILRRTGEMERALTSGGDQVGLSLLAGGGTTLAFGADVPYAHFHQHGTKTMPRRLVIEPTPATVERMTETAQAYIVDGPRL
jgi:phage gpG-like protein